MSDRNVLIFPTALNVVTMNGLVCCYSAWGWVTHCDAASYQPERTNICQILHKSRLMQHIMVEPDTMRQTANCLSHLSFLVGVSSFSFSFFKSFNRASAFSFSFFSFSFSRSSFSFSFSYRRGRQKMTPVLIFNSCI